MLLLFACAFVALLTGIIVNGTILKGGSVSNAGFVFTVLYWGSWIATAGLMGYPWWYGALAAFFIPCVFGVIRAVIEA